MNVNLKSKELIKLFQNNGILTPSIAQKRANNILIDLDGPVTEDLLSDIKQIAYEFPNLLRHITVRNNTDKPINMAGLLKCIGDEKKINSNFKKFISFKVESRHSEDFNLDYGTLTHVDGINLVNTDPNGLATFNMAQNLIPAGTRDLSLNGFDLSTMDLNYIRVRNLALDGARNTGFAAMRGKERLGSLSIQNRPLDNEVQDVITFVNGAPNLHTFGLRNVDLRGMKILEVLRNPNLASLSFINTNISSLDGLEFWNGKLDRLSLDNNGFRIEDVDRLNKFRTENNETYVSFGGNREIQAHLNATSQEDFSGKTYLSIYESFTNEFKGSINKTNALKFLMANKYIPYCITDAARVRRDARITLNPMFLDRDSDLETLDFNQDYLVGGTLLLTVSQVEKLIALNKNIPMNISIRIKDASELSSDKLREIYEKIKITDIRMFGSDLSDNQRNPYTPIEYVRARELLDEVVSGIDPKETDIDKFATVYTRLAKSMGYDYSAIKSDTTAEKRHTRDVVNTSRNLVGGLSTGQCVCAGYAETLRNALSLIGIKARYVRGKCFDDPDYTSRHAWSHVYLDNGQGEKRWYLTDLTWDDQVTARPENRGQYNYMLLGEPEFKKNHQVTYTNFLHPSSPDAYDRVLLRRAIEKADQRYINPREGFRKRQEEKARARMQEEQKRKDAEEKKRQEEERKREEELKKKSEAERKKAEELKRQEEEKRKAELESISYDGLNSLKNRRDVIKTELDNIYAILRKAQDLPIEKQKEYRDKALKIEEEIQKMNNDIDSYKDKLFTKESKELKSDEAKLAELRDKKAAQEKAVAEYKEEPEMPEPKPMVEVNKTYLDEAVKTRVAALETMIASREAVLIGYGDKANPNREQQLQEWKRELADIKAGKIYDSLVEDAKQNEKSDLKIRIANREAMIAGRGDSLNPMRFTELEEWKNRLKELEGAKEIGKGTDKPQVRKEKPVIDPELDIQIANLEKQISERKARLEELSVRENISFERFEIKDEKEIEEAIKKTEKISHKEQKNREKEERIYSQTHLSNALRLQTKQDLISNERRIRSQHVEDGLLRITNRILNRNDEEAPDWVKSVIEFGVGITMKARNTLDRWVYGEDKYDAELQAVKNSSVVITKETPRMEGNKTITPVGQKNVTLTNNPKLKTKDPNSIDEKDEER